LEKANARVAVLAVAAACLVGMADGSALTYAFLTSQRAIPSAGLIVAVDVGIFDAPCSGKVHHGTAAKSYHKRRAFPGETGHSWRSDRRTC